jgi:hypothetical protein
MIRILLSEFGFYIYGLFFCTHIWHPVPNDRENWEVCSSCCQFRRLK